MPPDDFYVYVLPARDENILKIGFSRDPLTRIRAFHPRYYEWFALDEGFLLPVSTEREVRRAEQVLAQHVEVHRSRSPAEIRRAAGGHTEWYRGALSSVREIAQAQMVELGAAAILPVEDWLRDRLDEDRIELYEWSLQMFDSLALLAVEDQYRIHAALRDSLDAYAHFGIDIAPHLAPEVQLWWKPEDESETPLA